MRLQGLEIQAFRIFRQKVVIDFGGESLVLLYGANSNGKTSIAEAIEFVFTGDISRRKVYAASQRDFRDTLRNVSASQALTTEVALTLTNDAGVEATVRRIMTRDCTASSGPASILYLKDKQIKDWNYPTHSPSFLFQHTLRQIATLPPKERVLHFKQLLSIDDLDRFRDLLKRESQRVGTLVALPPLLTEIHTLFPGWNVISDAPLSTEQLRARCSALMKYLLKQGGDLCSLEDPTTIQSIFVNKLNKQRKTLVPLQEIESHHYDSDHISDCVTSISDVWAKRSTYLKASEAYLVLQPALYQLYQASVELYPDLTFVSDNLDCPLCEAKGTLTIQRLFTIRDMLKEPTLLATAKSTYEISYTEWANSIKQCESALLGILPAASRWAEPELLAMRSLLQDSQQLYESWVTKLETLSQAILDTVNSLKSYRSLVANTVNESGITEMPDISPLFRKMARLNEANAAYTSIQTIIVAALTQVADEQGKFKGWSALIRLWNESPAIMDNIRKYEAARAVSLDMQKAVDDIDRTKALILDEKMTLLSNDIGMWWNILRPSEPVRFHRFERPGSGINYLDMKAEMGFEGTGITRDAIGIFSDSQLNCLGLTVFTARSVALNIPILIYDDPIQSMDDNHRACFQRNLVEKLLSSNRQVIVLTHDQRMWETMKSELAHFHPWIGQINLMIDGTPTVIDEGTGILSYAHKAEIVLLTDSLATRRDACKYGRIATEKFCKAMLVEKRRAKGESVGIAEYDEKPLEYLIKRLDGLWDDPSHRGKVDSCRRRFNPGVHDDTVPPRTELIMSLGDIRSLVKQYMLEAYR